MRASAISTGAGENGNEKGEWEEGGKISGPPFAEILDPPLLISP